MFLYYCENKNKTM